MSIAQHAISTPDPQQSLLEAYGLIVMIAAIGLAAVVLVLSVIIARRMARRRTVLLERATQKRRAEQGPPPEDAWQKSAERYVDTDRLTPEEIAQRAAEDPGPCENDGDNDDGDNTTGGGSGSAWDDAIAGEQDSDPGEDDPYGLFEDKPYIDPDEDEDEDDPGDGIDPDEPWR